MIQPSGPARSGRTQRRRGAVVFLSLLTVGIVAAAGFAMLQPAAPEAAAPAAKAPEHIKLFMPLLSNDYNIGEKIALVANVFIALGGLLYALMLVGQVKNAPLGTPRMQEIARAVREGANAYLYRQFRVVAVLIVLITVLL